MNDIKHNYFYKSGVSYELEKRIENFNELKSELNIFQKLYKEENVKIGPAFNVRIEPRLNGVSLISVFHNVRQGILSKKVKTNEFMICVNKLDVDGYEKQWMYVSKDINEVSNIFLEFIENQKIPDVNGNGWTSNLFFNNESDKIVYLYNKLDISVFFYNILHKMSNTDMPYFLTNKDWYNYNDKDDIKTKDGDIIYVKLTEEGKQIAEVVTSYEEFLKQVV